MKNTAEQVMSQACYKFRYLGNNGCQIAQTLGGIQINGQCVQGRSSSFEYWAIVDGQDCEPCFSEGTDGGWLQGTLANGSWRPRALVPARGIHREMLLNTLVEQHRGGYNQHSALGRHKISIFLLSLARLSGWEIKSTSDAAPHHYLQPLNHCVQVLREGSGRQVCSTQRVGRLLDRSCELIYSTFCPATDRFSRLQAQRPCKGCIG